MTQVIAYYRVSTRRQGQSGLGLDGQRLAIQQHCRATGDVLLAEFTEIESGRLKDRPQLAMACRLAKARKATLIVAKLDRLTRNVAFLAALMESRVDFVACDFPLANKLTLHILAAVAEHEADMIGERTKAALAAAKVRGTLLGSHRPGHWDGREQQRLDGITKARTIAAKLHSESASEAYLDVIPTIRALIASGSSLDQVAGILNGQGLTTRQGCQWRAVTIQRILKRMGDSVSSPLIPSPLTPK